MFKSEKILLLYNLQKHFLSITGWLYLLGVMASGFAAFFDSIGLIAIVSLLQVDNFQNDTSYILDMILSIKHFVKEIGLFANASDEFFYTILFLTFFALKSLLIASMLMILAGFKNSYMYKCRVKFYNAVQSTDHNKIQTVGLDRMVNVGTEHINQSGLCYNFFMHFQAQLVSIIVYSIFILNFLSVTFLYAAILILCIIMVYIYFGKIISENSKIVSKSNDYLTSWMIQLFSSIKSLKFGPGARMFIEQLKDTSQVVRKHTNKIDFIAAWLFALREPFILVCIFIIIVTKMHNAQVSVVSIIIEQLPLVFVLYRMFNSAIRGQQYLNNALSKYGNAQTVSNTFLILDEKLNQNHFSGNKKKPEMYNINIRDLIVYPDNQKRNAIGKLKNLNLKANSRILILGDSGSGKTSFVDTLLKINLNGSGIVDFRDASDNLIRDNMVHRSISYVEQKSQLFSGSVLFNITFNDNMANINKILLDEAIKVSCLDRDLLKHNLTLSTFVGDRARQLSGGQVQRLAIARAIYSQSSILVFDEVTSGFDNELANIFNKRLAGYRDPRFIFYISHRINSGQLKYFTDALLMSEGEIQHYDLSNQKKLHHSISQIKQYLM